MGASSVVRAQAKSGDTSRSASQTAADKQRLKSQLERVNAEIDSLKRDGRSLRDDYLLRSRMADAESLARQLTALDARSPAPAPGAKSAAALAPAPEASPADDRAVLEAKADILADQARRLNSQADVLAGRVTDLRARNELRRRAGQLERDPFSALEQAKRRLANAGTAAPSGAPPPTQQSAGGEVKTVGSPGDSNATGNGSGTTTLGTSPTTGSASGSPTSLGATATSTSNSGTKAPPALVPGAAGGDTPGSVALQFQGILDATTLAEIRRLESTGAAGGSVSAMEHALTALRARAAQLSAKANALRTSAKTAP